MLQEKDKKLQTTHIKRAATFFRPLQKMMACLRVGHSVGTNISAAVLSEFVIAAVRYRFLRRRSNVLSSAIIVAVNWRKRGALPIYYNASVSIS